MEEQAMPSVFDELANEQPYFEYATQGQRFGNYLIDIVIFYVFFIVVIFILSLAMAGMGKSADEIRDVFDNKAYTYLLTYICYVIFYTLVEGISKGMTLGKLITRTRAVKEDLSPITFKDALIRSLGRIVPFEPFSAFGGNPWHDKWSKTIVIKKRAVI